MQFRAADLNADRRDERGGPTGPRSSILSGVAGITKLRALSALRRFLVSPVEVTVDLRPGLSAQRCDEQEPPPYRRRFLMVPKIWRKVDRSRYSVRVYTFDA